MVADVKEATTVYSLSLFFYSAVEDAAAIQEWAGVEMIAAQALFGLF